MSVTWPTCSVVIPTYNRCSTVERTLRQLAAQDYPAAFELIVVDNSSDETPAMVRRVAGEVACPVHLIHLPERLPAVKRNLGLRKATGDLVIFMNDDVWVGPDFLTEHARSHQAEQGGVRAQASPSTADRGDVPPPVKDPVAVIGLCEQSPEIPVNPFTDWFVPFDYTSIADRADQSVPWIYFWTMNISLPRQVMIDRNLVFHEDWAEIGEEDVELGYRWIQAGYQIVYNPRARGDHFHPHSLASASALLESIGRGVRDLEALVPEQLVLERWGIFSWRSRRRAVLRGLAREILFNELTTPLAKRWLNSISANNRLSRWMYWKVLMHHANRGYRRAAARSPEPVPIQPLLRQPN